MDTKNAIKKKYRMSLLYLLKDLLKSMLIGGILLSIFIVLLMIFGPKIPFDIKIYSEYICSSFVLGAGMGIIYKCIAGGDIGDYAGVTLYNTYAGIHNTLLFSGAGFSFGAAFAVIGLVLTAIRFVYKLACTIVVFPMSFVYLCIMALIETIFNGIPVSLGNFLDKIIPIAAKICGLVATYFVVKSWGQ